LYRGARFKITLSGKRDKKGKAIPGPAFGLKVISVFIYIA